MISDDKRREVAAELREASTGAYRHVDALDVIANSIGIDIEGKFDHEAERETYAALADLIDRSTCEDVGDFDHEAFKCSRCGYRVLSLRGIANGSPSDAVLVTPDGLITEFAYCPNCGAEVTDGD